MEDVLKSLAGHLPSGPLVSNAAPLITVRPLFQKTGLILLTSGNVRPLADFLEMKDHLLLNLPKGKCKGNLNSFG